VPISTSVFELYEIGPGPSSSHTIAPMRAANDFMQLLHAMDNEKIANGKTLEIRLFGSLSATGKGHGTDVAIIAGLHGQTPENYSQEFLDKQARISDKQPSILFDNKTNLILGVKIIFDSLQHNYPFSNTILMRLLDGTNVIFEKEYYSVGGGFIQWKGWTKVKRGDPVYPYLNMEELKEQLEKHKISFHQLVMENEKAITGSTEDEVSNKLEIILQAMENSVNRGLKQGGILPGPIGLHKRAYEMITEEREKKPREDSFLVLLNSYAYAAAEENAMGHKIVTAPTSGSAGVMAAVVYMLMHDRQCSRENIKKGLLVAAAIGFLAKHNANISGAEVGCQGEIGVASSMGAAMLAYINGSSINVVESAAKYALEHHLGITCDPVAGCVQIPCISRCAMGAIKAYNAFLLASSTKDESNKISLDVVIKTMLDTGTDMSSKYKETSMGGLATHLVAC